MARIIIDTREQRGWEFPNAVHKKLDTGDYSIVGLETRVAIERKSADDLLGTFLRGRARFAKELQTLQGYDFACVIVECSMQDILSGNYRSEMNPHALLALLCNMMIRYKPVSFIFGGDRPHSYALAEELLNQAEKLMEAKYGAR